MKWVVCTYLAKMFHSMWKIHCYLLEHTPNIVQFHLTWLWVKFSLVHIYTFSSNFNVTVDLTLHKNRTYTHCLNLWRLCLLNRICIYQKKKMITYVEYTANSSKLTDDVYSLQCDWWKIVIIQFQWVYFTFYFSKHMSLLIGTNA